MSSSRVYTGSPSWPLTGKAVRTWFDASLTLSGENCVNMVERGVCVLSLNPQMSCSCSGNKIRHKHQQPSLNEPLLMELSTRPGWTRRGDCICDRRAQSSYFWPTASISFASYAPTAFPVVCFRRRRKLPTLHAPCLPTYPTAVCAATPRSKETTHPSTPSHGMFLSRKQRFQGPLIFICRQFHAFAGDAGVLLSLCVQK